MTKTAETGATAPKWRLFESVLQRENFGIETSDAEMAEKGDEKVIHHGLTRYDAEQIVSAFNTAVAKIAVNRDSRFADMVAALEEIERLSDNCVNAERYGAEEALEDLQAIRVVIKRIALSNIKA